MVGSAARVIVLASVLAGTACAPMCARSQGAAGPPDPAPRAAPTPAPAAAPHSAVAAGLAPHDPSGEPRAAWHVAEDEHVRVEELRVRGESRQITVQPKMPGSRPYEIVPASGAIDPSQRGRRAPGTSQWRVLSF